MESVQAYDRLRAGAKRVGRLAAGVLLGALAPVPAPAQTTPEPPRPAPAAPAGRSFALPSWLQVHGEQRTRYETIDNRYRPSEVGGDDLVSFRTRLQVRVATTHWWVYSETQDSRVTSDDSASTINFTYENDTKVQQLHAGVGWTDLGARKLAFQVEAGRFSRDFGFRRVIARNLYRNTTNAYDGLTVRLGARTWSLTGLASRPVFYTYPEVDRDPRFDDMRFGGLYFTTTKAREASADLYALILHDGEARPAGERRTLNTPGGRLFGQFGPDHRAEYEVEAGVQWGDVGGRDHQAWFQHSQVGYNWPDAFWRPRLLALWDYASGDEDPTDARSGAWDPLLGARRFEFGPVNLYGLVGRSNLNSPAAWFFVRPSAAWDFSVQLRGVWLAEARDQWRPMGLVDPTGQSGTHVGTQTELRLRHRIGKYVELDGGLVFFDEGRFVRALKPSPDGHGTFAYFSTDFKF